MSSITQQIPNYIGGISEQPDELKIPGQVKDLNNAFPDLTYGLMKRPGGQLLGGNMQTSITTVDKWFHYYRDENEQYIGQIARATGLIKMWRCAGSNAGQEVQVRYWAAVWGKNKKYAVDDLIQTTDTNTPANTRIYKCIEAGTSANVEDGIGPTGTGTSIEDGSVKWKYDSELAPLQTKLTDYLKHNDDEDVQTLTLNDYTYITNRLKIAAMSSDLEPARDPEAYLELKKVAYASQYSVNLFNNLDLTDITTATRIDIERLVDSSNGCKTTNGDDTPLGILWGSTAPDGTVYGTRCDQTAGDERDGSCPNVKTDIYSINAGDLWERADSNDVGGIFTYTRNGTTYGKGAVYETDEITVADNTTVTLTVEGAGGVNDVLTAALDADATFDEMVTALKADADYDTTEYEIFKSKYRDTDKGSLIIYFKGQESKATPSFENNSLGAATNTTVTKIADHTPTTTTLPTNLYFRLVTTGQAVALQGGTGDIYRCRYTTVWDLLYGGQGWKKGDYFTLYMNKAEYRITVVDDSTASIQGNLGLVRPLPTPFDSETTVTSEAILGDVRQGILDASVGTYTQSGNILTVTYPGHGLSKLDKEDFDFISGGHPIPLYDRQILDTTAFNDDQFQIYAADNANREGELRIGFTAANVKQIGNGIYLTRKTAFNLNTPVSDLFNVFTKKIKDIADLPSQCRNGYVVTVANSGDDEDDYYVKFIGSNNRDGEGVWEEAAQPGVKTKFDPETMPLTMVRTANGEFCVKHIDWDPRLVGDTTTVPEPSFIGQGINKLLFFRNRMVLLADENVIMSRPGDFYNFWPKTAVTYTASDHIDLSCSSEYPATVYDGIQVNAGLLLFTKNQQFMLTTDSDVLSPQTAKINSVATYNFNYKTNPISMGTTVAFLDNAGKYTRFFEITNVLREGQPEVIEQSKVVSKLFPKDITLVANSRENSVIFFTIKNTDTIYGYRYFNAGTQRAQASWFKWKVSGKIQHLAMLDDGLFAVIRNNETDVLQKFSVKLEDTSHFTTDDIDYRIHLDNSKVFASSALTYNSSGNYTHFPIGDGFNSTTGQLAAFIKTSGRVQGQTASVTTFIKDGDLSVKLPGDWTSDVAFDLVLGYLFEMEVKFPTIYFQQQMGERYRSDVHSNLVLHRVKFSFGPSGVYETTLARLGKPDYTELYESTTADQYLPNKIGFDPEQKITIPIYERNTNLTLTLKSKHPSPATLFSMAWEGDYTGTYYKRV